MLSCGWVCERKSTIIQILKFHYYIHIFTETYTIFPGAKKSELTLPGDGWIVFQTSLMKVPKALIDDPCPSN